MGQYSTRWQSTPAPTMSRLAAVAIRQTTDALGRPWPHGRGGRTVGMGEPPRPSPATAAHPCRDQRDRDHSSVKTAKSHVVPTQMYLDERQKVAPVEQSVSSTHNEVSLQHVLSSPPRHSSPSLAQKAGISRFGNCPAHWDQQERLTPPDSEMCWQSQSSRQFGGELQISPEIVLQCPLAKSYEPPQ
jgi:hypothetical protein